MNSHLSYRHALLALLVVFIWGTNFVVIKVGLAVFPPFLFATLRFLFCAMPLIFFVPRPKLPMSRIAGFGVLQGVGMVGLMFLAMKSDISPGLASLVIQFQVFFTIVASRLVFGETIAPLQRVGLGLAAAAIGLIGWQSVVQASSSVTSVGLLLTMGAAASWAALNLASRSFAGTNAFHLTAWSSAFSASALLVMSLLVDGWRSDLQALATLNLPGWGAVLWQSLANTLLGFGIWSWLLGRYPSASIVPFGLLVPVFGIVSSAWWTGESLPFWKGAAMALLMCGLTAHFCAPKMKLRSATKTAGKLARSRA